MNVNKLKGKIIEKGLTVPELAKLINVDRSSLYRKLNNSDRIRIGEAVRMKEALSLTDKEACEIFLN